MFAPVENRGFEIIFLSVLVFLGFSVIEVLDRTVISGDTTVYLGILSAFRAIEVFSGDIAVFAADGIRGRKSIIGQTIIFCNLADNGGSGCANREASRRGMRGIPYRKYIMSEARPVCQEPRIYRRYNRQEDENCLYSRGCLLL